jgi:2-methylaconitate cis-trans-isomerase PrpF
MEFLVSVKMLLKRISPRPSAVGHASFIPTSNLILPLLRTRSEPARLFRSWWLLMRFCLMGTSADAMIWRLQIHQSQQALVQGSRASNSASNSSQRQEVALGEHPDAHVDMFIEMRRMTAGRDRQRKPLSKRRMRRRRSGAENSEIVTSALRV